MQLTLKQKAEQACDFILNHIQSKPEIGIVLGTGLGSLVNNIKILNEIDYIEIPNFPLSTVESHKGKLIFGTLNGKKVLAMQGRFHYYEGYTMQEITFPIRVMKMLGIENLIITNACGNLNKQFQKGDLMLITDHINLIGDNPLIGVHDDFWGARFTDMYQPYNYNLIELATKAADNINIKVQKGVYASMSGPSLETRAEYRMLQIIGADAIGMSTVPECIVANQMNMKVLGISILSDDCFPETLQPLSLYDIINTAAEAEPKLTKLVDEIIRLIEI
jgi:purine-nucleoside phosphorylase